MMKKISLGSVVLALSVAASSAYADIPLESKEQIQGNWKLQYTKINAAAKENIPREDIWAINGDKIAILNIPREGGHYDQPALNFELENGKLKIPYLGRSGFDMLTLVDKTSDSMTLKGKFGEHYYFTKK